MKYVLNAAQMKACDQKTIEIFGVTSLVLMERASLAVVDAICSRMDVVGKKFLAVCGSGNNGGDGFAVARLLARKGADVTMAIAGDMQKATDESRHQFNTSAMYDIPFYTKADFLEADIDADEYDCIIDAVFGIGLTRDIKGDYEQIINKMNSLNGLKVAVDISSGISADTAKVLGCAFKADLSVTFGFAKIGQLLYPGNEYTGELIVADMGIDEKSLNDKDEAAVMFEGNDLGLIPARRSHSNKGTYGKILVIAGSSTMSGAAYFSGRAAYNMGAGLVKLMTHKENKLAMQLLLPEAILSIYDENSDIESEVKDALAWADAVVVGPGLSTDENAVRITKTVLENVDVPCVVDADALNVISKNPEFLENAAKDKIIITPHLGEMSRLTGKSIPEIASDLIGTAKEYSKANGITTVLKDANTVVSDCEGHISINTTGNHGMATGGSGDVLTGIIAMLAWQMDIHTAARIGVMVHGMAGDAAADRVGKTGLLAGDILDGIRTIFKNRGM